MASASKVWSAANILGTSIADEHFSEVADNRNTLKKHNTPDKFFGVFHFIDGTLLNRFMAAFRIPNFRKLLRVPCIDKLLSVHPPIVNLKPQ